MHKSRKKYREREIDSKKLERTMKMLHVIKMMTMKMNDKNDDA